MIYELFRHFQFVLQYRQIIVAHTISSQATICAEKLENTKLFRNCLNNYCQHFYLTIANKNMENIADVFFFFLGFTLILR